MTKPNKQLSYRRLSTLLNTNNSAASDNTRVSRPILPVTRKINPGETVIYKYKKGLRFPTGIVKSKQEAVSQDNRSSYQKRQDDVVRQNVKNRMQEIQNRQAAADAVSAIGKLVSPSTYVGAAARSLTGDGAFMDNLAGGTGFNDTTADVIFDVASPLMLKFGASALNKYVLNPTYNSLRNKAISSILNRNIRNWDGTVGPEYFRSPYNWYRYTETPEIEGIREMGKNITTRDATDINIPSNNWRTAAMDNYSKSNEGYWYKADMLDEDAPLKEFLEYTKNNTNKPIGFNKKYGSAHGNKTQAAYGKAWDGSISSSGIGQLGLLEGQAGVSLPFGKTRTSFVTTPIEEIPLGGRIGFSTGEMPLDNLGWFTKLPNGRFKYQGKVLPYKRIDLTPYTSKVLNIMPKRSNGRYQFDSPTYQMYTGPQHDISEIINTDGSVNLKNLLNVQNEALQNVPGGTIARHRLENAKWHLTDWNTFLHTRDAYKRALDNNYPQEALFPTLMHDFGKMWSGDGHGPYGASIVQQIFPKASKEQIQAIYGHMDANPVAPLTRLVKGVDIKETNPFRTE